MKKILIILSIIFLCACEKCDCGETNTNNNQSVENKDEYLFDNIISITVGINKI